MALYPGDELAGDTSNWWGPNVAALRAMLREEGFSRVEVVYRNRAGTAWPAPPIAACPAPGSGCSKGAWSSTRTGP
jgi:hypothetical protein